MIGTRDSRLGFLYSTEFALLIAIVAVVACTTIFDADGSYLKAPGTSARDIIRNLSLLGIFSLGAAVVIISGGIDLSSGSVIAFSGTVCAGILYSLKTPSGPAPGWAVGLAIAGALGTGFAVGTLHTWLITAIRLPPFVATLATLVGLRSLARALCEFITTPPGGGTGAAQIYVNHPALKYLRENIWIWVAVFGILSLMTWIILRWTVLGRHIYAVGGNEQAARLSGIQTDNVKWVAYTFSALTSSIAAIFYISNELAATPFNQAVGHELNAIAAAVVGGCSLQGGVGTVQGTILGVLFLRVVIDSVSKLIDTGADVFEGLIVGCVVLLAVTLTQARQLVSSGRQLFAGIRGLFAIPALALAVGLTVTVTTKSPMTGATLGGLILVALFGIKVEEVLRRRG
jgi:ribose/xylose/arabinose/galactoside ABC-type transport system permease subunit